MRKQKAQPEKGLTTAAATAVAVPQVDHRPSIVGQRIVAVRPMTREEVNGLAWCPGYGDTPMVIVLQDGSVLVPQRDPEGNGPGAVLVMGARSRLENPARDGMVAMGGGTPADQAAAGRRVVERYMDLLQADGHVGRGA